MPTGYTYPVAEGKIADFPTFAMQCARGMGALVMMRDEPMDAPIPEKFEPSTYNLRAKDAAEARLLKLQQMSPDEIHAAWEAEWRRRMAELELYREEKAAQEGRYRAMLAEVEAWEPPSPDHIGFKKFMRDQLLESIKFDCGDFLSSDPFPRPDEWHRAQVDKARRDTKYHARAHQEEVRRAEERTRWVQQLRDSLKQP